MSHPFAKLFERALKKSTIHDNLVQKKAEELLKKGYRKDEVCEVLEKLAKGRVDEKDESIIREALAEIEGEEDETF